jgi:hypothetical protein
MLRPFAALASASWAINKFVNCPLNCKPCDALALFWLVLARTVAASAYSRSLS